MVTLTFHKSHDKRDSWLCYSQLWKINKLNNGNVYFFISFSIFLKPKNSVWRKEPMILLHFAGRCNNVQAADIVFLIDGSSSIGRANFLQVKGFMAGIVKPFASSVSQSGIRFGAVQYSDTSRWLTRLIPTHFYYFSNRIILLIVLICLQGGVHLQHTFNGHWCCQCSAEHEL